MRARARTAGATQSVGEDTRTPKEDVTVVDDDIDDAVRRNASDDDSRSASRRSGAQSARWRRPADFLAVVAFQLTEPDEPAIADDAYLFSRLYFSAIATVFTLVAPYHLKLNNTHRIGTTSYFMRAEDKSFRQPR